MAYDPPTSAAAESSTSTNDQLVLFRGIRCTRRRLYLLLALLAAVLLVASAVFAALLVRSRDFASDAVFKKKPSQAIARTCTRATYPSLCITSLVDFPGAMDAGEPDLVHISVNMTLQRVGASLFGASGAAFAPMDSLSRAAYDDCLELLDDSVEQLSQSLAAMVGSGDDDGAAGAGEEDVTTWLSAALTNQDTCGEGLGGAAAHVRESMEKELRDLAEHVSNSLAIFSASPTVLSGTAGDGGGRRRRLLDSEETGFPGWLTAAERRLLETPMGAMQADIVVSKDGGKDTYKTITAAIKAVPEKSSRRTIIYVRAGR